MRIPYNVDRKILVWYDYQFKCYDRWECLCAARNFFKPAETLCSLNSKRLYNLVATGKLLACLAASILAAQSIIRPCSVGSPIRETESIECQSSHKRDMSFAWIVTHLAWMVSLFL